MYHVGRWTAVGTGNVRTMARAIPKEGASASTAKGNAFRDFQDHHTFWTVFVTSHCALT
jgi:hypothetical protein